MAHEHNAMKYKAYLFTFILLFSVFTIKNNAHCWIGKCASVSDGDTIGVMHSGKEEKIRLYGIDCPENGQDFGNKAKQFTSEIVFGKEVNIIDAGLGLVAQQKPVDLMFDITMIPKLSTTLYIPHVAQNSTWDTFVLVCNPNDSIASVRLTFVDGTRTAKSNKTCTIPKKKGRQVCRV